MAVAGLLATACGGSDAADDEVQTSTAPTAGTEAPAESEPPATEATDPVDDTNPPATDAADDSADDAEPADTDATEPEAAADGVDFSSLEPATGDPMIVGLVNTEGPAGLDFPEIRSISEASVEYLNEHGGMGGRPMQLEVCIADSSPESSQACAQELSGKGVEMVFLGLDLFPDYPTYAASGIPVTGVLPLFPADYAAEAIYMNGGNATLGAAIAATAAELFQADNVAIVSADNPGTNGSEAAAIAALEAAGISYRSIKGSDNETDAGFQGLVREALSDDPQVLISLYGDAGCVGMMRGRVAIGTDVPVIASNTCAVGEVLEAAGDDAMGWYFTAGGDRPDSVEIQAVKEAVALDIGGGAADVRLSDQGLGSLPPLMFFTFAAAANDLAASGGAITGQSVYDHLKANESGELSVVPDGGQMRCGAAPAYQSVCNFNLFIGEYVGDGRVDIVDGFEDLDVLDYLP